MNKRTTKETVARVLEASMAGDPAWIDELMAPDGVIEWPYRPEGVPGTLNGRTEMRAFFAAGGNPITFREYQDIVLHETNDPEVAIVEYTAQGTVTATGAPFTQRVIAVIRVRDGLVAHYRDYINPLALMAALSI